MKFAASLLGRESKGATERSAFTVPSGWFRTPARFDWNVDKAVSQGMEKVTWVFRAVHIIASNQARLPILLRDDDRWDGPERENHPLLPLYNRKANPYEKATGWRYRLSCLLLLSRKGVFVEIQRNRLGEPIALYILPPGATEPIKDPDIFVKGYEVKVTGQPKRTIPPEDVLWFRIQHPTDPYRSLIPLEACGLAVETDWWARLYNRNFMSTDGRLPAGIVVLKGEGVANIDPEDVAEVESRLSTPTGGTTKRISLMASPGGADLLDLSVRPKDAEWLASRAADKNEIAVAFGTPLTVLGDTSGRTYENADADRDVFWGETMPFHLEAVASGFDDLDDEEELFASFDISGVPHLQKAKEAKENHLLELLKVGAITVDEYREATGREPLGGDAAMLWRPMSTVTLGEEPVRRALTARSSLTIAGRVLDVPAKPVLPSRQLGAIPRQSGATKEDEGPDEDTRVDFGQWKVSARRLQARRRERLAKLTSWERTARISMERYFTRQARVVNEKLTGKKVRDLLAKAADEVPPVEAIFDRSVWGPQLKDDAEAWITGVVEDFGSDVVDAFEAKQVEVSFDLLDPEVIALIEERVNQVVGVNQTTYELIQAALAGGVEEGETIAQIAGRVQAVFDSSKVRAERIARTEVIGAANGGSILGAKAVPLELEKVWLSTSDNRTRPDHAEANGQAVALTEKFDVAGYSMDYPGDPIAPAEQVVNCRCTVIYAEPEGKLVL